ncbi:DUF357 domain-containing protein [Methanospirillum lacunae]|uniref:DUF357 domain-containing protein n=1 Tax=Methanospirillum lacunae TaxID=668570 RepID=A0A2V2N2K7_9EURY|nr:DUF357 domain-containing protein [Methanospirillum lacunae]PWR73999.1 hypothetical protein DK846_02210 [Methanospirillum lacunae]
MNPGSLEQYRSDLSLAYSNAGSFQLPKTPLGAVTAGIREMISSYLTDSEVFYQREDLVNEYAALLYAHGWFDAAIYLGYLTGLTPPIYLPEDKSIPCDQHERLLEKRNRYELMLHDALGSIEIAPPSGSPLYTAAVYIRKKGEDVFLNNPVTGYMQELGLISYGYGWIDAGLRAGLFNIVANPHLFTTETDPDL